jgi:hypothetical protein
LKYHLPVLPPTLITPAPEWRPKETFSPSAMQTYAGEMGCARKYAFGYGLGVFEFGTSRSRALGSLIHASIEHYLRGGTCYDLVGPTGEIRIDDRLRKELATFPPAELLELAREAIKRAIVGVEHLPHDGVEAKEIETWISIDTRRIIGNIEPLRITGKIDLSFKRHGVWYLVDHKSTKGARVPREGFKPWAYAKKPEDLKTDPQGIFYALDRIYKYDLTSIWSRWIYYLTDPKAHPQSHTVDVELHRAELEPAAYQWLIAANDMRKVLREAAAGTLSPLDIPAPTAPVFLADGSKNPASPCNAFFVGCPYRADKGGPCDAGGALSFGNLIAHAAPTPQKVEIEMTLIDDKIAQAKALNGGGAPLIPHNPALMPPEALALPVVAAAPPALPAGWVYGADGRPIQAATQPPPAPPGWQYGATGQLELIPPPAAPPAVIIPPPVVVAPVVAPEAPPVVVAPVEGKGKRGRPKGAKNAPKLEGETAPDGVFVGELAATVFDAILEAASSGKGPLGELTVAQIYAIRDLFEAA